MIRQRNVFPSQFEQDQFTVKLDNQFTMKNRLSGTFFFTNFPGLDSFPDPSSLASPVTLLRNDRARTLALSEVFNIFNNVNFAIPANDLQDGSDLGKVLNTLGGPRVMQFALRFLF